MIVPSCFGILVGFLDPDNQGTATSATSTSLPRALQFSAGYFEREGPINAAEQCGRTIYLEWNADHPFYQKVISTNCENRDVINAVNARVFSMAAELRLFTGEDEQGLFESWKTDLSSNLRILLS